MSLSLSRFERFRSRVWAYRGDRCGAAGVEFALVLTVLLIPLLNATDIGIYVYDAMELNGAAQAAAEAALLTCGGNATTAPQLPATTTCTGLSAAVTAAAHSTSQGSSITVTSTSENYYCVNSSGVLVTVGTLSSPPADCSGVVAGSTDVPGDYVLITTSLTYTPLFTVVSLGSLLPTPIRSTAWMRLGS